MYLCVYYPFFSVEPVVSESEKTVLLTEEKSTIEISFAVPFVADKQNFKTDVEIIGCDDSLLSLSDWNYSEVDEDSDTSLITCVFEVDSPKVMDLKDLPIVNLTLADKEGLKKHLLVAQFETSKFSFQRFDQTYGVLSQIFCT